ncbi:MBL fold metallo-hydrolase RNA specificity domain-containing protein [Aquimarina agarivorans]|uniref:MBL fold metallo-hydrolase RNA specificity domain-containing protein n=1 Tax=Aquimarina agarivorans TaxID=980584 RepID=UPI000248E6FA|nr:MBL fold metallo-hydrolase RNA specificity domain-containing protein [Aquimarina agarivorans]
MIDEPNTTILLIGYQAEGTRGRKLLEGVTEFKIYGKYYSVKATIEHIESLSVHADRQELIGWMSELTVPPEKVFLIHGEQEAQVTLKNTIETVYKCNVSIPKLYDVEVL